MLGALPCRQCGVDDTLAMPLCLTAVVAVDTPIRRRVGPFVAGSIALTTVRAAPADGAGLLDELRRDLVDEPRRRVVVGAAEQLTAPGVGQEQPLLGTGDADVREASLLLELHRFGQRPAVREHTFFHTHEEHRGELQTLRGVERHQHDTVVVVEIVGVGHQGHLLEELVEPGELASRPDQLAEVLDASGGLDRAFGLELGEVAAVGQRRLQQIARTVVESQRRGRRAAGRTTRHHVPLNR